MKATVTLENIKKVISRIGSIPRKGGLDMEKGVRIEAIGKELNFYVTNEYDSIRLSCEASVVQTGSTNVNFFWLSSIIKGSVGDVTLSSSAGKLEVTAGSSSYSGDEVQAIPFPKINCTNWIVSVPGNKLIEDLDLVKLCSVKEGAPEVFQYINVAINGNLVLIGATDLARVAVAKPIWTTSPTPSKISISLKQSTIEVLKKVNGSSVEDVKIYTDKNLVYFCSTSFTLISRLGAEKFPMIYSLLPKTTEFTTVEVSGLQLFSALERINRIAGTQTKFKFSDKLELVPHKGGGKEVIPLGIPVAEAEYLFDSGIIAECVKNFKKEQIKIEYGLNTVAGVNMMVIYGKGAVRYYIGELIEE